MYRIMFAERRNGSGVVDYHADFDPPIEDNYALRAKGFPELLLQTIGLLQEYNKHHSVGVDFEKDFPDQHRYVAKRAFMGYMEAEQLIVEFSGVPLSA